MCCVPLRQGVQQWKTGELRNIGTCFARGGIKHQASLYLHALHHSPQRGAAVNLALYDMQDPDYSAEEDAPILYPDDSALAPAAKQPVQVWLYRPLPASPASAVCMCVADLQ